MKNVKPSSLLGRLLLIGLVVGSSVMAYAQPCATPSWPATAGANTQPTEGHSIAIDNSGNVYVTGLFDGMQNNTFGSITIDPTQNNNGGLPHNFYLAKYNSCGVIQWVAFGDCNTTNKVYVAVDPTGADVYVSGTFQGDMIITDGTGANNGGGAVIAANSLSSVFLAKFSASNGAFNFGNIGQSIVLYGNPYPNTNSLLGLTVTALGPYILSGNTIVRYTAALGVAQTLSTFATCITSDPAGNIYAGGILSQTSIPPIVAGFMLRKFTATLAQLSTGTITVAGAASSIATDVYVDGLSVCVTGQYSTTGSMFAGASAITGSGGFACKFTDLGAVMLFDWGVKTPGIPSGIAANIAEACVVGPGFTQIRNAINGALLFSPNSGNAGDVAFNLINHLGFVVTGTFSGSLTLNTTVTAAGVSDMYTARISLAGIYQRVSAVKDASSTETLIDVYPNPVENMLTIAYTLDKAAAVEITLMDLTGKAISINRFVKSAGECSSAIDASDLQQGVYMLQCKYGNNVITRKITKVN